MKRSENSIEDSDTEDEEPNNQRERSRHKSVRFEENRKASSGNQRTLSDLSSDRKQPRTSILNHHHNQARCHEGYSFLECSK